MQWTRTWLAASLVVGAVAAVVLASFAKGAPGLGLDATVSKTPLGRTGGFGEPTCLECHSEFGLNPEGGTLAVEGLPSSYEPGQPYVLKIVLEGEGMTKGGYQAALRFSSGARTGQQAGSLMHLDARSDVRDSLGVSYGQHTAAGAEVTEPDRVEWSLVWTAPASTDPVVLHLAANSANGDASPLGDWVLALERRVNARQH